MKPKLHTFAHKQILREPMKKLVQKWPKYSVHMTKAWGKTSEPFRKQIIITFSLRFYDIFFIMLFKLFASSFCKKVADP